MANDAVIHDGNLDDVLYGMDTNSIVVRDNDTTTLEFFFFLENGESVVKEKASADNCALERLDNNKRTRISRNGTVLIDVTSESVCNAIDAIEFGFGISDLAKQVEKDEKEHPGLKMAFFRAMMGL